MGSIVVGFDGTDGAEDALALGVRLARATGDDPVVVAVHPESPPGMGHVDAEWQAAVREQAEHMLDRAREVQGGQDGVAYRSVGSSSASHGLADVAETLDATAIVLGSGHQGALRRTWAGSTAERLLQGTSTPVVIPPRGYRGGGEDPVTTIGVAFLDTPDGREALRVSADLASRVGARLRVFTVVARVAEFSTFPGPETERTFTETARGAYQRALDAALATLPEEVTASGELLEGDVVQALAALDTRDVDLLVCGSRGYGPVRRVLLGGTSARLVRHAAAPVMVVPRSDSGS